MKSARRSLRRKKVSKGETVYSLDSPVPHRVAFDLERVMRTQYRIDTFQNTYFVIDSFAALFNAVRHEFPKRLAALADAPAFAAGELAPDDHVLRQGTPLGAIR